jgi:hypothetical protein
MATHVPIPPLSGSSSIEALAVALAEGLAMELADALALAVAPAEALTLALSCTNKTFRLSAKVVPTANAL